MKPILFNTEMVRAILDGRKTVTRRVVKISENLDHIKHPYTIGDILYVRETWRVWDLDGKSCVGIAYKADDKKTHVQIGSADRYFKMGCYFDQEVWKPSIHMPKEVARIFLKVTGVRIERLQDISEDSAVAEGFSPVSWLSARDLFANTWQYIYLNWDANPWVWVIEFERCESEVTE